jgi:HAD superfamily hydrolase (TIGR01456 family)
MLIPKLYKNKNSRVSTVILSKRMSQPESNNNFGIVFDIDGVLSKFKHVLPGAKEALKLVQDSNIPHVFATNFGGTVEAVKAESMTQQLGVTISPEQLLLSHNHIRQLLPLYQDKLVLVVGRSKELTDAVMQSYSYTKWVWFEDFIATHPALNPMWDTYKSKKVEPYKYEGESFAAVFYLHEPEHGTHAEQLLCDVLLSNGLVTNDGYELVDEQVVEIYFANTDLFYSSTFKHPRMTVGSFALKLAFCYKSYCGRDLRYTLLGKPNVSYFEAAKDLLLCRQKSLKNLKTIYMIGDNPASDIRGANQAGEAWFSVLVKTGVFKGETNDETWPAKHVADNVLDAVQFILKREGVAYIE